MTRQQQIEVLKELLDYANKAPLGYKLDSDVRQQAKQWLGELEKGSDGQWVKVEDAVPDAVRRVLIYIPYLGDKSVFVGIYMHNRWEMKDVIDCHVTLPMVVTHWREIGQPILPPSTE